MDIVAIIAIIIAYIVKGITGFANTLVFGTLMSFSTNNINITPIDLLLGYPANVMITWRERKSINPKVFIPLSVLVIIGIIPGVFFLKNGDASLIKILFGFAVIAIGIENLIRHVNQKPINSSRGFLFFIGMLSGLLCGMFGVGALLVAYINRTTTNQQAFRGNLCMVFVIENSFRIIIYTITGILTMSIVMKVITLIPFMILGLVIGIRLSKRLHEGLVRKIVVILLIISGMMLIINNLI